MEGLVDRVLAVTAMLLSLKAVLHGSSGPGNQPSWRRLMVLAGGALAGPVGAVGLLALRFQLLDDGPFFLPDVLGVTLAAFGGLLGVATLLARRADSGAVEKRERGLTEDQAIAHATLSATMILYVALPVFALCFLGLTRLMRAALPFTIDRNRTRHLVEGLVMIGLAAVPREHTLGGLRQLANGVLGG
ncbi:MAG: hypothetical protein DHS20C15_22080 [Planctomycetota bacterium]|nr:MAG: hypothetical protein DHS20C15_22080 [Planctomycetota bacterium]